MTKLQLFHSQIPGNVPPEGLLPGEIALNVADSLQFVGYGGDVNYDVYGNPLPDLPPPGMGWKTFVTGGGDQPGPPGPGVPAGGETGQVLTKLSNGDYVTGWVDTFGPALPSLAGVVYGLTSPPLGGGNNVSLGYEALYGIGAGTKNVAIGYSAAKNQSDVDDNVSIGYEAGLEIDGFANVLLGSQSFGNSPGGVATGNVGVGYQTGFNVTSGDFNVFLGYQSGIGVRTGSGNVIVGGFPGDANMTENVILSSGTGDVRFASNQYGAWSTDGSDFGTEDFVLTSQGPNLPPAWKPVPLGFVSRIVAGNNVYIDPVDGTGVVTINATGGGGGGGISAIQANAGLKVSNGGTNPITTSGGLEVDFTKVVATSLYNAAGTLLIGSGGGGPAPLPVGSAGQVLQVSQSGAVNWASLPSASPATPTVFGLVYGSTNANNTYYGYGSGVGVTGTNNIIIGEAAGTSIGAGTNNTVIGSYQGTAGMSNSIALATGAGSVRFFSNAAGAWSVSGDSQFGQAGQVLTSQGAGAAPKWVAPINAPITDVVDGAGISTSLDGTTLTINNEGILSVSATAPIQATTTNGNVTISAPTVLSSLTNGTGISITGSGNTRQIANTGVVQLQNGTNTTVENVGNGVWKVNATGGGGGGITSLTEGTGITIANPGGPSPTITNSGILNVVSATPGTLDVSVSNGIATLSVNGGSGVTKLIAGANVSLSPTSGVGEVTISAAGGGGGGSITQITSEAGSGISVTSGTGPVVSLANTGVLEVTGGTGIRIDPNGPGKFIVTNTQAASAVLSVTGQGDGISVSPTTGAVVVQNTGVTSLQGTEGRITVTGGTTGALTLDIGSNVVTSVAAGNSGITIGGTASAPTVSASVVGVTAGAGIDVTNTNGSFAIKNSGVIGVTAGSNVTITETEPDSGIFQISSTGGGGGGGGTVTSITAGYGLSGGNITSSGTIAVKGDVVVTYDAYRGRGAGNILYSDSTGYDWTNNCSSGSPVAPMYLQGYQVGPATYVRWLAPEVGGFQDSPSITFHKALSPIVDRNEYYFEVSSTFQQDHCLNWSTNLPTIRAGQIPYGYPNVAAGQTNSTQYLNPPSTLNPSTTTWFLSGQFNQPPLLTDLYWQPKWNNLSDYAVTNVSVTAPILNTGTSKLPNIAFDVNTTALTKYVPTTAITLAGQILYGTGAGTVAALNIGNNGQVLSVSSSGLPQWIDPPTPGSQINLTPGFGIELSPNPITGSGEIAVKANTFIETAVILNKGDMIYGSAAGVPARLAAGTAGQVLQMSNTGIPAWVTDVDAGTY